MTQQAGHTAPLKTLPAHGGRAFGWTSGKKTTVDDSPLLSFARRMFLTLTDVELLIASCLIANVIFAVDRLAGVIR